MKKRRIITLPKGWNPRQLLASSAAADVGANSQHAEPGAMMWLGADTAVDLTAAAGDDKLPTFNGIAYTGGKMRPMGFSRDVYVDLAGCTVAPGQRPIHRDHTPGKVVGHAEAGQIVVGRRQIKVAGTISGTGSDAQEVLANGRNGFRWRLSIGASIDRIEWIEEGESALVNGMRCRGGCYVVRACTIFEISFVSLAGDDGTSATVSATTEGYAMNFIDWLQARGKDINKLGATELAQLRAAFDAEQQPTAPTTPPAASVSAGAGQSPTTTDPQAPTGAPLTLAAGANPPQQPTAPQPSPAAIAAAAAEQERLSNEREAARLELTAARSEICARFGNPTITIGEGDKATQVPLLVHATRQGWDANTTELHARRESRPDGLTIHTPSNHQTPLALEASLCMTAGISEEQCGKDYDERTMNAALDRGMRGANLKQLFCMAIAAAGRHVPVGRFDDSTIRAALECEQLALQASGSSTFSVSGILSNVANKKLLSAYQAISDTLSAICKWGPVNDFKPCKFYRLTVGGEWAEVPPDGEIKSGRLHEQEFSAEAVTRGLIIGLTRTHIRNDDLGAFLSIPTGLARKSANKKQKVGFGVLKSMVADGDFHADNGNLISGGGSVLAIAGLTSAVTLFKKQTDTDGDPIAILPDRLITGSALAVTADELHTKTNVDVRLDGSGKRQVMSNPHAGKYTPHDSPYLDAEHGGSDTAWYLALNPEDVALLNGVALDGRMVPFLERGEMKFSQLGMEFRAYDDWGIGKGDAKGGLYSAGA